MPLGRPIALGFEVPLIWVSHYSSLSGFDFLRQPLMLMATEIIAFPPYSVGCTRQEEQNNK